MKLPFKKGWAITFAVLLLLMFLNPNYNAFKEFTGLSGKDASSLHREVNGIVFSIYENTDDDKKYIGILQNFIPIPKFSHPPPAIIYETYSAPIRVDTFSIAADSTKHTHTNRVQLKSKKEKFDFNSAFDAAVKESGKGN